MGPVEFKLNAIKVVKLSWFVVKHLHDIAVLDARVFISYLSAKSVTVYSRFFDRIQAYVNRPS